MESQGSEFLSVEEVARELKLHPETVRRMARDGSVPAFKVGRGWRFSRSKILEWAEKKIHGAGRAQVLVVDDEEGIRELARLTLEPEGYELLITSTAEAAIAALEQGMPDAAVLDLMLPGRSGLDVIRRIRETDAGVPIIIMTGYPDSDMMSKAMEFSPLVVLAKPVRPAALASAVRSALEGRRSKS
jgi:excisionase family DNA binding protein